jgi:adenosylmethionine-8-amino-7-oxononanoate aminotransferase
MATNAIDIEKIKAADYAHLIHPLFHPVDQKDPYVWVKGEGAILHSADGKQLIDGLSGLWNVTLGHGRKDLAAAAAKQMEELAFVSGYVGATNVPAVQLAEKLSSLCYPSINHFFFTAGGGESIETAFKTARFFWITQGKPGKSKIISRDFGYHGVTIAAMSATGLPVFWPMFGGKLPGFLHIKSPYPYRFVSEDPSVSPGVAAANLLEKAILEEGPETVAAFLAEPVQGSGGLIVPPDDYFPRIREICDKYDVLFIADEIITGFGRTGRWFGLEHYGVQPDMITFAKAITSGYIPLGGVGVSDRVYKVMSEAPPAQRWMHAFTYSAHPVGCAVGLATIAAYEKENLVEASAQKGKKLLDGVKQLLTLDHVGDVRGLGTLVGLELVEDKATKKAYDPAKTMGAKLHKECCARGLYSRIRGDIYCLAPPFITTDAQIDQIINILGESVKAVTK